MTGPKTAAVASACLLLLLTACEARIGSDGEEKQAEPVAETGASAAEGKAEAGTFSIDAPGFDLKLDIPDAVANRSDSEGDILYPGARISGMHVAAEGNESGVELRFASADPPAKVAAWYRDPARKDAFAVTSARQDGEALVIAGTETGDGDPFTLRLSPAGTGTDGRLTLSDRR